MNTSHKWLSALAAAAALSTFSLPSHAAEPSGNSAISKTVKTWDLDFAKTQDVQTFNARVRDAANDVCTAEARRHWSSTRRAVPNGWREQCVNDAVEAAVREVGNRRLAMGTTGRPAL
jgi:UrcA family protein